MVKGFKKPAVQVKTPSEKIKGNLESLKKSMDYGLITKEEYEEHKAKLEGEMKGLAAEDEPSHAEIAEASSDKSGKSDKSDLTLWIAILCIILVVGGLFFGIKYIKVKYRPLTIDELNELNMKGKLKADDGYMYKGVYSFVFYDGLWYTQVQTKEGKTQFNVPLHYSPRDLEDIKLEGRLNTTLFNTSPDIYVTFNPFGTELKYVALATGELDQSLIAAFGKRPVAACLINETIACRTRPIINCTNTAQPVVFMKQDIETKVILSNNCVILQGQDMEMVRATDRFLLAMYGIMN